VGNLTLKKALEEYTVVYMPYRNFAERTREEYRNDLDDFIQFAEKSGLTYINQVGLPIVQRFIAGLEHKGYSSFTRKRKVVTIRSFFSFLYSNAYSYSNLASRILVPFVETPTPHILTQVECDRLRATSANNPRDAAMIELLLQTGIKLSELIELTLHDVDFSKADGKAEGLIRLRGIRGKKDRLIALNQKAILAMRSYLKVRENAGNTTFFLNRFGEPVSDRGVQKILRKYLKSAGIGKASVHTLRHTYSVQQINAGESLRALKEALGLRDHRSVRTYVSLVVCWINTARD
jgi:site-specific recombinase XerD